MLKRTNILLIGLLSLNTLSVVFCSEQRKHMPEERSPLATSIIMDHWEVSPDVMPGSSSRIQKDGVGSFRVCNKKYGFEVGLESGNIAQRQAAAIIIPFAPGNNLSQASLASYKQAGQELVLQLHAYFNGNREIFEILKGSPGNSLSFSSQFFSFGNLAVDTLALMYVPLVVNRKTRSYALQMLCAGLYKFFMSDLYPKLQKAGVFEATVVLPALGNDPLFKGYQGAQPAKKFLGVVVSSLRYLYGLGHSRLKNITFVVDNEQALKDYHCAFNDYFEEEGISFARLQMETPELS